MMTTSLKRRRYVTDDGTEETNSLEKIKSMIEDLEHQMVELHIENVTRQVEISKLRKEIAEVTWSTENLSAESTGQQTQLSELRTEVDSLVPASDMVFDMRYRAFLVCLRDIWGIENEAVRKRVGAAGKELVHADIKVDARMFFVKGLAGEDELYFKKIYGVTPKVVVDLGEFFSFALFVIWCLIILRVLTHISRI